MVGPMTGGAMVRFALAAALLLISLAGKISILVKGWRFQVLTPVSASGSRGVSLASVECSCTASESTSVLLAHTLVADAGVGS